MNVLRFTARLLCVLPWLLLGLLSVTVLFPLVGPATRCKIIRRWSRLLLVCCGIAVRTRGVAILDGPVLTVANHISWIDIFVLNSVRATGFIAKSDIRRWPIIGWLVAGAGTVFIERGQRHAVSVVSQDMHRRFDRGEAVGLFPEGTTSVGNEVLPFHASLFEPARSQAVTIQPVALRFMRHDKPSSHAAFVGEETLVVNLWRVLGATGLSVEAIYLPPLPLRDANAQRRTRQDLARDAHAAIAGVLVRG